MMANDVLASMLALTACVTLAALAVLIMRRSLRVQFGAGTAYAAWLLLPVAIAAAAMPFGRGEGGVQVLAVPIAGVADAVRAPATEAPPSVAGTVLALWLLSSAIAVAWQRLRYRAFVRQLGALAPSGGVAIAQTVRDGPLLLGVLRPLVVLPADFHTRYSATERELILAHEQAHARRRDPLANTACVLLQCIWWFNPVIHYAARCFRMDQELACDQAVMRAHPGRVRAYAEAMLKTQLSTTPAPFACQWQSIHPLKERILNLSRSQQNPLRRLVGRAALTVFLAMGGWSAWAAQGDSQATGVTYDVAMALDVDGSKSTPRIHVPAGQEASMKAGEVGRQWGVSMKLTPAGTGKVFVQATLTKNGEIVSKPAIQVLLNEKGTIMVGDPASKFSLELTVRELPAPQASTASF